MRSAWAIGLKQPRDWHIKRQHIGMELIYLALITAAHQGSPPSYYFPSAEEFKHPWKVTSASATPSQTTSSVMYEARNSQTISFMLPAHPCPNAVSHVLSLLWRHARVPCSSTFVPVRFEVASFADDLVDIQFNFSGDFST